MKIITDEHGVTYYELPTLTDISERLELAVKRMQHVNVRPRMVRRV